MLAAGLLYTHTSSAQKVVEPKAMSDEWSKPYEPFRIAGNLYYVGTYDLACYLVTTPQGNILINTGLAASTGIIRSNIEKLGFRFADTKILLTTQVHYDHVGAMAEIKKLTGAKLMVDEKDAAVMQDGGTSDYYFGGDHAVFKPAKVDRLLRDHDTVALGGSKLVLLHHPGHTKGSCSFLLDARDGARTYRILIANMPSIIIDGKFSEVKSYPGMAADYKRTLQQMKAVSFDLWVASHASQFDLHTKRKAGDNYNPAVFADKAAYQSKLRDLQQSFDKKMKE
ncbi:subclass B3 metallo-beta-lactamase [Chitinophaga sedimenti]|nr:subclass B3 metallo-beta-lactamase [Chitinophaga sedimenti]MCK7554972.1 subclass B3 metallo-beta-lactamase [Chitinophaga sedimenti]